MDWFPLLNSLRIALISTVFTFFLGILAAYYIAKTPRLVKGVLDVILTLPLVLPPTVIGFFILKVMGPRGPVGSLIYAWFETKVVMTWYSAIFACVVVAFPLMYRTARGAFESFDVTLRHAGQTLGHSNTYIFWRIMMPACRQGVPGRHGAGLCKGFGRIRRQPAWWRAIRRERRPPSPPPSISSGERGTTLLAYKWVAVNIAISFVVLIALNILEHRNKTKSGINLSAGIEEVR